MKNKEIATLLYEIVKLLELKGENRFRIHSYEKAAINIENLSEDIQKLANENKLSKIPAIGESITGKIEEYLLTGKMEYYESLKKEFPDGLLQMLSIQGVGPKTARLLYTELGIKNIDDLESAAKSAKIQHIPHLGEQIQKNILRGINLFRKGQDKILLSTGLSLANSIIDTLIKTEKNAQICAAGSLRRKKETIRDIDLLCTSESPQKIMDAFINLPQTFQVIASGKTKSSIIIEENIQVDLRVVEPDSYGAALQYFTGSKTHNIKLRELAIKKGYKINEYGLFEIKSNKKIAGKNEKDIYNKLGLDWIEPELRENRGEIESAQKKELPKLIEYAQVKGDLHVHSNWSDGSDSIDDLAKKAKQMNLEWIAICDHSKSLKVAHGLDNERIFEKIELIKKFNQKSNDFKILCGAEVDILSDGSLDYEKEILEKLDFVLIAIHSEFKQDEETMTKRILKAMENKYVHMFAHPSGRLLKKRESYNVNMDTIIEQAHKTQTFLEINANPLRLDLSDTYCYAAKNKGVLLGIGSDAHIGDDLKHLSLGIHVARRGWLEKGNIINTLNYNELMTLLQKKH